MLLTQHPHYIIKKEYGLSKFYGSLNDKVKVYIDQNVLDNKKLATHRHNKRDSEYLYIGTAELQVSSQPHLSEGTELAVYRSIKDGKLWARPWSEFNDDNRFTKL